MPSSPQKKKVVEKEAWELEAEQVRNRRQEKAEDEIGEGCGQESEKRELGSE